MSDDDLARGIVAAALARLDEIQEPLRILLGNDGELLANYFMRLHHQDSIHELRTQGFKTNDIVEIDESIVDLLGTSQIKINGIAIDLEMRELLVVFVLARKARGLASARGTSAPFITVSILIAEIDRVKAEANRSELWVNAIDTDVHRAVASLRKKIGEAGFNRNLIENKRNNGYRLSTPHWNLIPVQN